MRKVKEMARLQFPGGHVIDTHGVVRVGKSRLEKDFPLPFSFTAINFVVGYLFFRGEGGREETNGNARE